MADPSINDVCDALALAITTGTGLRALGYIDEQVNPPMVMVYTMPFDPRLTTGGSPERSVQMGARVFVRAINARSAQADLRGYMEQSGSGSIRAAIEDDTNWSVTVDYAEVTQIGQPFEYETANEMYWAVDFSVDVVW